MKKTIIDSQAKTKKLFKSTILSFFGAIILLLPACNPIKPVSVTGVNITDIEKTILVEEIVSLTAEVLPNNATNKMITWASDDESVATVDNQGQVTGESLGETTITITTADGNFSDACTIYVVEDSINVTGITLNQNTMTAYVGDTPRLIATIQPLNATNKNIIWSSTNTNVATIDDGLISTLSAGTTTLSATTLDGGFFDTCLLTVEDEEVLSEIIVDTRADFYFGSYETNFGTDTYGNIEYGFYRADEDSDHDGMIKLFPSSTSQYDYGNLPGAFFNNEPISGIKKITLSFISESGLTIRYGETLERGYSQTIVPSNPSTWTTTTISLGVVANYFSINTTEDYAYLKSVTIGYNSSLTPNTNTFENEDKRIAPTVYSGTLVDGVSSVSIPDDITISGDSYTINSYRNYTYYSFNYVFNNKNSLNLAEIAMTDPVDVANYYIAFHAIPANYGKASSNQPSEVCGTKTSVSSIFDDDTRQITSYTRTDGYATSVPWRAASGNSTPTYYEFDIALDSSYSTSNRSIGRLVMWTNGWSCYSDGAPVATYTDDHYATFGEYLNYGRFGSRFDSEPNDSGFITGYENQLGSTQLDG